MGNEIREQAAKAADAWEPEPNGDAMTNRRAAFECGYLAGYEAAKADPERIIRAAQLIEKRRHYPVAYCRKLAREVLDAADGGSHD
jgi:hypothetical protein